MVWLARRVHLSLVLLLAAAFLFPLNAGAQIDEDWIPPTLVSASADCSGEVSLSFDAATVEERGNPLMDEVNVLVSAYPLDLQDQYPFERGQSQVLQSGQSDMTFTLDTTNWNKYQLIVIQPRIFRDTGLGSPIELSCNNPVQTPSDPAQLCQGSGYLAWTTEDGSTFKNVGQCVKYAAQGGLLKSAP